MRKIVLVLTAAVMLAAVCFRAAKAQSELIQGEKRPDTVYRRTNAGGFTDGFGFADKRARIAFGE